MFQGSYCSKAFDRVWHVGLPHRINSFGISGLIFDLILPFLYDRRLRVVLDGKSLEEYPITAGVPQDSILALTHFLRYISDLPDDIICGIIIYADMLLYTLTLIRHMICYHS